MKTKLTVKGIKTKLRGAEAPRRRPIKVTTHCIVVVETEMVNGVQLSPIAEEVSQRRPPQKGYDTHMRRCCCLRNTHISPEKTFAPLTVC
jgi:hypothetical protein